LDKQFKIGSEILSTLFSLPVNHLKEKLKSIMDEKYHELIEKSTIEKTSLDDTPYEINVYFYNRIKIWAWGIQYHPEHGKIVEIVKFGEHFKL